MAKHRGVCFDKLVQTATGLEAQPQAQLNMTTPPRTPPRSVRIQHPRKAAAQYSKPSPQPATNPQTQQSPPPHRGNTSPSLTTLAPSPCHTYPPRTQQIRPTPAIPNPQDKHPNPPSLHTRPISPIPAGCPALIWTPSLSCSRRTTRKLGSRRRAWDKHVSGGGGPWLAAVHADGEGPRRKGCEGGLASGDAVSEG